MNSFNAYGGDRALWCHTEMGKSCSILKHICDGAIAYTARSLSGKSWNYRNIQLLVKAYLKIYLYLLLLHSQQEHLPQLPPLYLLLHVQNTLH